MKVPCICTAHVAYSVEAKAVPFWADLVSGALCSPVLRYRAQQYGLTTAVRMLLPLARGGQAWIVLPASAGGSSYNHAGT